MRTLEVQDDQLLPSMIDRIATAEGIAFHREVLKSWVERATLFSVVGACPQGRQGLA